MEEVGFDLLIRHQSLYNTLGLRMQVETDSLFLPQSGNDSFPFILPSFLDPTSFVRLTDPLRIIEIPLSWTFFSNNSCLFNSIELESWINKD